MLSLSLAKNHRHTTPYPQIRPCVLTASSCLTPPVAFFSNTASTRTAESSRNVCHSTSRKKHNENYGPCLSRACTISFIRARASRRRTHLPRPLLATPRRHLPPLPILCQQMNGATQSTRPHQWILVPRRVRLFSHHMSGRPCATTCPKQQLLSCHGPSLPMMTPRVPPTGRRPAAASFFPPRIPAAPVNSNSATLTRWRLCSGLANPICS